MWDAVHRGLEDQPCHTNITRAQVYPNFPKNHPQPVQALQFKGGPVAANIEYALESTLSVF